MRLAPALLLTLMAACARFPTLDVTLDDSALAAPYPQLQSIEPLLARSAGLGTSGRNSPAVLGGVAGRIAGLQTRAAALRGPVVDPATRTAMARGIDTSALQ